MKIEKNKNGDYTVENMIVYHPVIKQLCEEFLKLQNFHEKITHELNDNKRKLVLLEEKLNNCK